MTQRANNAALDTWESIGKELEPLFKKRLGGPKFKAWTERMNANVVAYAPDLDEASAAEVLEAMNRSWVAEAPARRRA